MALPRLLKYVFGIVGALVALYIVFVLVVLGLLLFSGFGEPSKDEVARVASPNGKAYAVLFETNGGATTSFGYEVYVVAHSAPPSGSPAISLYGAIRNQSAYGANLKWESPTVVAVEFLSAKSKMIEKSALSVGDQVIQLAVHEGITDNAAPSGGMLYNLQGRQ
jgi:hypothetical protein